MSKLVPLLETLFLNKGGSPELWRAILKVVNHKPEEAKHFTSYIKAKLMDLNQDTQILALALLDYIVVEGKVPLWTQVAAKSFITSLISVLKTRDSPEVQEKILYLIKKWGQRFESYKEILPNFSEIYQGMRQSNVVFPENVQADYFKYVGDDSKIGENYANDFSGSQNVEEPQSEPEDASNYGNQLQLNASSFDKKYSNLVHKISVWVENINLTNAMIDNTKVGSSVDDGLKSVVESLRSAENELVIYIQEKVKNEKLLEILLGINDDINKTKTRYDLIRAKKRPDPFVSNFQNKKNNSKKDTQRVKAKNNVSPGRKTVDNLTNFNNPNNDIFDLLGGTISNTVKNNNNNNLGSNTQSQVIPINSVDDIFEIFNNKTVESKHVPNTDDTSPQNNKMIDNQFFNLSSPITNNMTNNVNVNNDKKGIDLLTEKLKMAYLGNGDSQNQPQQFNYAMNNMMMKPNMSSAMSQPNMGMNPYNANTNTSIQMNNFNNLPPNQGVNYPSFN